ncbi:hypothetical protein C8R46DRAFT_1047578 [Mycena filopes]|nr:hypothetical protein C8R46DRAFT_1047578 [Mycena filopes]
MSSPTPVGPKIDTFQSTRPVPQCFAAVAPIVERRTQTVEKPDRELHSGPRTGAEPHAQLLKAMTKRNLEESALHYPLSWLLIADTSFLNEFHSSNLVVKNILYKIMKGRAEGAAANKELRHLWKRYLVASQTLEAARNNAPFPVAPPTAPMNMYPSTSCDPYPMQSVLVVLGTVAWGFNESGRLAQASHLSDPMSYAAVWSIHVVGARPPLVGPICIIQRELWLQGAAAAAGLRRIHFPDGGHSILQPAVRAATHADAAGSTILRLLPPNAAAEPRRRAVSVWPNRQPSNGGYMF